MRVGTAFFLVVLVMIGFGFLLSDNVNVRKDLNTVRQQLAQAQEDLKTAQDMYDSVNTENSRLKDQAAGLARDNELLQVQVHDLLGANQILSDQNAQLLAQVNLLKAGTPVIAKLLMSFSNPGLLAIFIPIIPFSLGAVYVLMRSNGKGSMRKGQPRSTNAQRTLQVKLTEEEMRQVIHMRRGR